MTRLLPIALLCTLAVSHAVLADSGIEPHFGHPYVFADRIVFASVDGTHLIGIDKQGRLQWESAFPARVSLQRSADQLLVQSGRGVDRVNVADGTRSQLFWLPANETLIADDENNFLAVADSRFDHKHVRIINPLTHSTEWESSSIESIVHVTASTVVAVTADRKHDRKPKGYSLEHGNLRGFDRHTGQIHWSMPLSSRSTLSIVSAEAEGFLAVIDWLTRYDPSIGDSVLIALNPDTGATLSKRIGNFEYLWPLEDAVGVLERTDRTGESEFYVCKLPGCSKENPVLLSTKEALRVRVYGEYIITAGFYDTACFERATGARLWEKGQLEWSQPFDDEMVVMDFSPTDQSARIVAIELRSGQERVLFSRKVTLQDKGNFKPW
jgi:outer membrane protein assembly factor BamB